MNNKGFKYVYTKEEVEEAVANSRSYSDMLRYFGRPGRNGNIKIVREWVERYDINVDHFYTRAQVASNNFKIRYTKHTAENILVLNPPGTTRERPSTLKKFMIEVGVEYVCAICGLSPEWNGLPLQFDVDHINGNGLDNRIENLRFLCQNCHGQQTTSKCYQRKYYDDKFEPQVDRVPKHGTIYEYTRYKCRCEPCREAKRSSRNGV